MILTGKCKEDFQEWFYENDEIYEVTERVADSMTSNIEAFYGLPFAMQQGVYHAFFMDKRIKLGIYESRFGDNEWYGIIYDMVEVGKDKPLDYEPCYRALITKAVEIYNGGVK